MERCADPTGIFGIAADAEKGEAARVNGRDCDFLKGEITVLGDPATGTKELGNSPRPHDTRYAPTVATAAKKIVVKQ